MNRQLFFLSRLAKHLWLRATGFAVAAAALALLAHLLAPAVPRAWVAFVGQDPLEELLKIMASSMLAVATFSLTAVVMAYGSATTHASPRAAALLLENKSAQNALSVFVAAFIYSIVGLVALGTGLYEGASRFALFVVTLGVLGFVVVRLLHWIDQVSHLGRVGAAINEIEAAVRRSLARRRPFLGALPDGELPPNVRPIAARRVGYVQHIDVARLDKLARRHDLVVHVGVLPGSFAWLSRPLLHVEGPHEPGQALREALLKGVVIGDSRTFQQDPRFGLVSLSEVASRALSPALNDPGTAIDVIGTAARLLSTWAAEHWEEEPRPEFHRVTLPGLSARDCFEDDAP